MGGTGTTERTNALSVFATVGNRSAIRLEDDAIQTVRPSWPHGVGLPCIQLL
jgi:hypothetical protein